MSTAIARLDAALGGLPRVALGAWPTPLVALRRLGDALGLDLWMKRDEVSGLALGGNKARKLEFVLGAAVAAGARAVVTAGPVSSNHTMMTAAAARRLGLDAHVVLGGTPPEHPTGNLALTGLFGARVHFTAMTPASPSPEDLAASHTLCARLVRDTGGFWIPPGATMPESVPGYVDAVRELLHQCGGDWPFAATVVAYGTGSTSAGLLAGLVLADLPGEVIAVSVSSAAAMRQFGAAAPDALVQAAIERYGWTPDGDALRTRLRWVTPAEAPGYGVPTAASQAALRRVALDEGYLLDPTYTAKAFATLMAMAADGRLRRGSRVLFVHTGGLSTTAAGDNH